jgi:hypothetical protein
LIAASFALLAACAGPDPVVEHVAVMPSPLAGHTRIAVDLVNRSAGHGQIQVRMELRDTATGELIVAERMLELSDHQRTQLVTDIETPAGQFSASVRAQYPD